MATRILAMIVVSLLALVACEKKDGPPAAAAPAAEPAAVAASIPADLEASFVNKVWVVSESKQVAPGEIRVFLSDGTLVMASPHAKPAFGGWRYDGGHLTITEEGRDYPVDIIALSESAFRIRMHSPGEPVEILFAPAEQSQPETLASAMHADIEQPAAVEPKPVLLWGTAWRLENLAGAGVLNQVQATLEFPSEGQANGNGSCNRFNGVVTAEGNTIQFGGIAATRKACAEAAMRQEDAYFAALREAERFELGGQSLSIYARNRPEPLRFVAGPAPTQRSTSSIERAPAGTGATPDLAGIWTVVGHYIPGNSALSDTEARTRYGETLRLTENSAISSGQDCRQPRYIARQVPGEAWLASEYKLSRGSLPPLRGRGQIGLLEVSCGGASWSALGARILEIDADHALAPWDGVFFQLARDRDFRAIGQEPGWQLEIHKGAEMRFVYDYGRSTAVMPAAKSQLNSSTGTRTYHSVAEGNDLRVEIVPVRCTDAMSGREFQATVSVTLNERSFRGCGEELATPYQ